MVVRKILAWWRGRREPEPRYLTLEELRDEWSVWQDLVNQDGGILQGKDPQKIDAIWGENTPPESYVVCDDESASGARCTKPLGHAGAHEMKGEGFVMIWDECEMGGQEHN